MEAEAAYSRAVVDGEWIFVSGTTGYDYRTMTMPEDAGAQARQAFTTLEAVLAEAGATLADIVRVRYIVTDRAHAAALFAVASERLGAVRPATTLIVAGLLHPSMKIEIEVTARRAASG